MPMSTQTLTAAPSEIRLRKAQKTLEVLWPDGQLSRLSCLALRKSCACSTCAQARQRGALSLIDADVGVDKLQVSGISGLQLFFSDGHYRGLYPWAYLRELGERLENHGIRGKQIRHRAVCVHLDHARGYKTRESVERNLAIRAQTRAQRITWTPAADGSVTQHWETSEDGGTTWATGFMGVYRRAPAPKPADG